jgi:hypothetical protein
MTVELEAETPEAAEKTAHLLLDETCRNAGLGNQHSKVVWITPIREGTEGSGHRFLEQAKELFAAESYELSIIAAQIHFETHVRLLMQRAAARHGSRWSRRLLEYSLVANFSTDVSKAAAELLLNIDVTQTPFWAAYERHRKRRNKAMHEGQEITKPEALESLRVVEAFWAELAKVELPTTVF